MAVDGEDSETAAAARAVVKLGGVGCEDVKADTVPVTVSE